MKWTEEYSDLTEVINLQLASVGWLGHLNLEKGWTTARYLSKEMAREDQIEPTWADFSLSLSLSSV